VSVGLSTLRSVSQSFSLMVSGCPLMVSGCPFEFQ